MSCRAWAARRFGPRKPRLGPEDRLCLVFPTGPELAVAYLAPHLDSIERRSGEAFAVRCTVAPLNLFLRVSALKSRGVSAFFLGRGVGFRVRRPALQGWPSR